MTAGRRRRRRGVTLSEHGYARVSTAQRRLELVHHDGARVSLERLSSDIGLSAKTLSRALNREMPVDLRTLEFLFAAYGLTLGTADYVAAEPFLERGATPLPQTRTTFFGREDELRRIRMLLEERRIVTLTGPGGVGKTRLAVELARDAGAHAYERIGYVDLSVINEAADIPGAVLAAFGAPQERRSPADVLLDIVDSERTLLIVDNCEHLVSDVADFAERILTAIPAARILATSREALGVDGEAVFRVAPLTQPVGFALFVERARAFDDSFEVTPTAAGMVASIVERVDGLPLAIELVAGRATLSGLQDVAESLQDRLDSIATDLDGRQPRHRSARALVDWSVRLLDDDERLVFRRLGVFAGSFDAPGAADVCADALDPDAVALRLARLVRKSLLVRVDVGGLARYRLLGIVKHSAVERLRSCGEAPQTRLAHALHYHTLAQRLAVRLGTSEQPQALAAYELDVMNIREALEWTGATENVHLAAAFAAALAGFWDARADYMEGEKWLRRATDCDPDLCLPIVGAKVHEGLSLMLYRQAMLDESMSEAQRALDCYVACGDPAGIARARNLLAVAALDAGRVEEARSAFQTNLRDAEERGDRTGIAVALNNLGRVRAERDGDALGGAEFFTRSLTISRETGLSTIAVTSLTNLTEASLAAGRFRHAAEYARRGLDLAAEIGNKPLYVQLAALMTAILIRDAGLDEARAQASALYAAIESLDGRIDPGYTLETVAAALDQRGAFAGSVLVVAAARSFRESQRRACVASLDDLSDALLMRAREILGERAFEDLARRGRTLGVVEALSEALGVDSAADVDVSDDDRR